MYQKAISIASSLTSYSDKNTSEKNLEEVFLKFAKDTCQRQTPFAPMFDKSPHSKLTDDMKSLQLFMHKNTPTTTEENIEIDKRIWLSMFMTIWSLYSQVKK